MILAVWCVFKFDVLGVLRSIGVLRVFGCLVWFA